MNLKFKKSWLPNLIAVIVFAVIAIIYFSPTLDGYKLSQGDITNHRGMSKEISDFRKTYGEEPLWTNSMFGGMPTYQTSTIYDSGYTIIKTIIKSPFSVYAYFLFLAFLSFFVLLKTIKTNTYLAFFGGLIYGLSTYNILIIEAGHNGKMHALASIPLVLAALLHFLKNNNNLIRNGALFALAMGYQFYCNHLQMTYYFCFLFAGIVIHYFVHDFKSGHTKNIIRKTSVLLIAGLLAVLSNFSNIYHTRNFTKHTMRGDAIIDIQKNGKQDKDNITSSGLKKDYITQWSYGIGETYNLLIPNAKGNSRTLTMDYLEDLKTSSPRDHKKVYSYIQQSRGQLFKGYWGTQPFTSGPNYVGSIIVFLALMYVVLMPGRRKWAIIIPSILAILLAWGKNFMPLTDIFIDYFPLYNKFRTVSSFLVVVNLTLPFMAILFLNQVLTDKEWRQNNVKKVTQVGAGIIGLILIIGLFPFGFDFINDNETLLLSRVNDNNLNDLMDDFIEFRKSIFLNESLKAMLQIGIVLVLLIGFIKDKIKASWLMIGVGAITAINLWMVDTDFLNNDKKNRVWEKKTALDHTIYANQGDYDIYKTEVTPEIDKIAKEKIKNFKKKEGRRITKQDKESILFSTLAANTNYRVLDLSNPFNSAMVSYFHKSSGGYSPAKLRRIQDMIDFYIGDEINHVKTSPEKMKVLNMLNTKYFLSGGKLDVTNPNAMGNAWFVENVVRVTNNNDEILAVENINPKTTAIIHQEFKDQVSQDSYVSNANQSIKLASYIPNHLTYVTETANKGLAVFSEIYYSDGWNAYIDGEKVNYARANYILRALEIPSGKHKVEFIFEPTMFSIGNWINVIGFLIILVLIGFTAFKKEK
ncbi:MAG: YfhO family protein [Flavobacteriales bacterium]